MKWIDSDHPKQSLWTAEDTATNKQHIHHKGTYQVKGHLPGWVRWTTGLTVLPHRRNGRGRPIWMTSLTVDTSTVKQNILPYASVGSQSVSHSHKALQSTLPHRHKRVHCYKLVYNYWNKTRNTNSLEWGFTFTTTTTDHMLKSKHNW